MVVAVSGSSRSSVITHRLSLGSGGAEVRRELVSTHKLPIKSDLGKAIHKEAGDGVTIQLEGRLES